MKFFDLNDIKEINDNVLCILTPGQAHYLKFLYDNKIEKESREYLSQNQSYKRFGRKNVERWVSKGIVKQHNRGRVIEYSLSELRNAANNKQDYLL